jgi:hypothetical protein
MAGLLLYAMVLVLLAHWAASTVHCWRWSERALRISRLLCLPALAAWMVCMVVAPPTAWQTWTLAIGWPLWWCFVHVLYHRHDHTRRLRDAATGWVRRRGSRLVVVPAAGGAR